MEASVAHLWRPLGEILIEWQLLSQEQLDAALHIQQSTGRRLGEVLIELEFVPRDVLVSVLLEQCGLQEVEVETQQGFGSGLLNELRKRGSAHRPAPLQVVPAAEEAEAPAPSPPTQREERRGRWARRKDDRARVERDKRVATAFARLEQWAAGLQRDVDELRRLLEDAAR